MSHLWSHLQPTTTLIGKLARADDFQGWRGLFAWLGLRGAGGWSVPSCPRSHGPRQPVRKSPWSLWQLRYHTPSTGSSLRFHSPSAFKVANSAFCPAILCLLFSTLMPLHPKNQTWSNQYLVFQPLQAIWRAAAWASFISRGDAIYFRYHSPLGTGASERSEFLERSHEYIPMTLAILPLDVWGSRICHWARVFTPARAGSWYISYLTVCVWVSFLYNPDMLAVHLCYRAILALNSWACLLPLPFLFLFLLFLKLTRPNELGGLLGEQMSWKRMHSGRY